MLGRRFRLTRWPGCRRQRHRRIHRNHHRLGRLPGTDERSGCRL